MADEHMPHKLCLNERRQLTMTGVTAVSYTHLDVYKRQVQSTAEWNT